MRSSRRTADHWKTWQDSNSQPTGMGGEYYDVSAADFKSQIEFTFFWTAPSAVGRAEPSGASAGRKSLRWKTQIKEKSSWSPAHPPE